MAKFDYDFMLGEHEVTCGEVADLSDDDWGAFAKCNGTARNHPIDSVSYYDAVYFANAKSRAIGEDSVYVYTRAAFDETGHCVGLEGLRIDANRDLSIVENYVMNHADSLKAVVLSLDLDCWRGRSDFLMPLINKFPGYKYDADHGYWADGIPENFVAAVQESYPAERAVAEDYTPRGGCFLESRSWDADPMQVYYDSAFTDTEQQVFDSYMERLMNLADLAQKKKVYLIGVIFPQTPQYKKTGSFGLYGMRRSVAKQKIAWLDSMAKEKPYFVLMDENNMGEHGYSDEMSYNLDHLSSAGARELTARLVKRLEQLK